LKLYIPEPEYPTLTITNDCSIIKKALSLQRFTKQEMQLINRVRIELKIIFILDLVDLASMKVIQNYKVAVKDQLHLSYYN